MMRVTCRPRPGRRRRRPNFRIGHCHRDPVRTVLPPSGRAGPRNGESEARASGGWLGAKPFTVRVGPLTAGTVTGPPVPDRGRAAGRIPCLKCRGGRRAALRRPGPGQAEPHAAAVTAVSRCGRPPGGGPVRRPATLPRTVTVRPSAAARLVRAVTTN